MWPVYLANAGLGLLGWKGIQALTDEEFDSVEYPEEFRKKKIDSYWRMWGGFCFGCWKSGFKKSDLSVDHVVPLTKGGRTSKHNAQVLCRSCNSKKSDKVTLLDHIFGRGGRKPRHRN